MNAARPERPEPTAELRLARLESAATEPRAILAALRDPAPLVRDRAIRLAARHLEPEQLVRLVADDVDATLRNAAIAALERQGPYAVAHLGHLLELEVDEDVVMFTLQVLARVGDPSPVASVVRRLDHANPNVRQAAVEALGSLRARDAVEPLIALLHADIWLQLAAAEALGAIGDDRAVAPLVELLADEMLAEPAARALGRLAAPAALPALLLVLDTTTDPSLAGAAVVAVATIVADHPELAGGLRRLDRERLAATLRPIIEPGMGEGGGSLGRHRAAAVLAAAAAIEELWPAVLRLAGDPDGDPWLEQLCRQHRAAAAPAARGLLMHVDGRVRRGALLSGVLDDADVPRITALLHDPVPEVRTAACRALGTLGATAAAAALVERLQGGDSAERSAAARALGEIAPPDLSPLAPCLAAGADEGITVAALEVIERSRSGQFEADVLRLARARSAEIRSAALRVAAGWDSWRADSLLLQALADRSELVQAEALELLVARGGERAVQTMTALLSTADSIRFRVIRALGRLRAAPAAAKLEALYAECAAHEALEVIAALAEIGAPGAREFLLSRLSEPDPGLRAAAARGLAEVADASDLPTFAALAADPEWTVREASVRGLTRLGAAGRAPLLQLGRDLEPVVAHAARAALQDIVWS